MIRFASLWLVCACATSAAAQTPAGSYPPAPAGVAAPAPPGTTTSDQVPGTRSDTPTTAPGANRLKLPPQTLEVTLSLFGGQGDDVNGSSVSGFPNVPHVDGDASMAYERRNGRATFGVRARSVIRHDSTNSLSPLGQQGGVDFSFAGARRSFHASQGVGYAPYYDFGGLYDFGATPIGDAAATHGDFANSQQAAVTTTTAVDWSQSLSRRYALSAAYSLRRTTFEDSPQFDLKYQSVGGRLTRRFTRSLSLRAGYTYRMADPSFFLVSNPRNHELDLGVDYGRPVALSRRTTVSFSTGSSLTPQNQRMAFNVTGDAALTRLIGRTWNARIGVKRSVQLLEGFTEPVLANAVHASFGGSLGRRVTLSSSVSYSNGVVGLDQGESNPYTNFSGGIGFSVALARRAAIEAQYFYAGYDYSGHLALAPGLTSAQQKRQGVRVGFTWRGMLLGHWKG